MAVESGGNIGVFDFNLHGASHNKTAQKTKWTCFNRFAQRKKCKEEKEKYTNNAFINEN